MTYRIRRSSGLGLLLAAALSACLPGNGAAQQDSSSSPWSVGADGELVSQYVWRGLVLNNRVNVQPEVYVGYNNWTLGVWASWPFDGSYREIDSYLSYAYTMRPGELDLTLQDYYYPESGGFFDFSRATGAHTGELQASFSPSAAPVSVMLGWNVYDDPNHSLFGRVSGHVNLHVVKLQGDIGMLLNDSPYYYGGSGGTVTDYTIKATRGFSLGFGNPHVSVALTRSGLLHRTLWVFAIGL